MSKATGRSFGGDFRQFFIRGLVILLPSVLTLWILVQAYRFVDVNIARPLNGVCRLMVIRAVPVILRNPERYPEWYQISAEEISAESERRLTNNLAVLKDEDALEVSARKFALSAKWEEHFYLRFIGFATAVILIYLAGRIFGGIIGRRIADRIEWYIARIPGFRQIYPHIKQIVDFVFGSKKVEFNRVALIEYPRKGIWTMGLITGSPPIQWTEAAGTNLVTLFVPSSPTPFTGYTITIPLKDVFEIDVTVEEAIRFSVSGGVVIPPDRAAALFAKVRTEQPLTAIENPVFDSRAERESQSLPPASNDSEESSVVEADSATKS